jgi:hypothetical protein
MKTKIINAIQHVLNNDKNLSKESRIKLEEALAKAKASKTYGDIKDVLKQILFFIRYFFED